MAKKKKKNPSDQFESGRDPSRPDYLMADELSQQTVPRDPKGEYVPPAFAEGMQPEDFAETGAEKSRLEAERIKSEYAASQQASQDRAGGGMLGFRATESPNLADRDAEMVRSEFVDPAEVQRQVGIEEAKSRAKTQTARDEEARRRRVEFDPTVRMNESGELEAYPEEVVQFDKRNASQRDLEMKRRYAGGDVPLDRRAEAEARLFAAGQRKRNEALRDIAVGSGLQGGAKAQFEFWKNSGGKWPGPYTSMSPSAIRAAQEYFLRFGKPSAAPRRADPNQMTMEEFQQRQAAGEFDKEPAELSIKPGDFPDAVKPSEGKPVNERALAERRKRSAEARALRRESGRAATIRAIMRRDPEDRRAQMERANRNLPPSMRIRPSDLGMPEGARRGKTVEVGDISDVSAGSAVVGAFYDAPTGTYKAVKTESGVDLVPVVDVGGARVPDVDDMDIEEFGRIYSPSDRRAVSAVIARSKDRDFTDRQRNIRVSRAKISGTDAYTESEKASALAKLNEDERALHYEFLQNNAGGGTTVTLPQQTSRETKDELENLLLREKILAERRKEGRRGSGNSGDVLENAEATLNITDDSAPAPAPTSNPDELALQWDGRFAPPETPVAPASAQRGSVRGKITEIMNYLLLEGNTPENQAVAVEELAAFAARNWDKVKDITEYRSPDSWARVEVQKIAKSLRGA